MKITMILNDAPYGNEKVFNALRLVDVMMKLEDDLDLTVFLLGDCVWSAMEGQRTPDGYYTIQTMLKPVVRKGLVLACETCMEARGLKPENLMKGCRQAKLGELGMLVLDSDKVLTF
ncbi:MAG: hypothetical protein GXP54_13790 [Deltaproteobacteria bacterium]|nr:hypothetical protein [Deltaproteobacteria bacterium]